MKQKDDTKKMTQKKMTQKWTYCIITPKPISYRDTAYPKNYNI